MPNRVPQITSEKSTGYIPNLGNRLITDHHTSPYVSQMDIWYNYLFQDFLHLDSSTHKKHNRVLGDRRLRKDHRSHHTLHMDILETPILDLQIPRFAQYVL